MPQTGFPPVALLGLLAGLVAALGFEPLSLWPLTFGALAGVIMLLARAGTFRQALGLGWVFGFGSFVLGLNWIAHAFTFQAAMPAWLGWIAVGVLSAFLAWFPALAVALAWWFCHFVSRRPPSGMPSAAPPHGRQAEGGGDGDGDGNGDGDRRDRAGPGDHNPKLGPLILALAGFWVLSEWLRSILFTGFPWNPLGVILVPTPADGWARLIGTYGLGGIVIMLAGTLVHSRRLVLAPVAFGLIWAGGWAQTPALVRTDRPVRIVQPDIDQAVKNSFTQDAEIFDKTLALTGPITEAPSASPIRRPDPRPRLVLWPEAGSPYPLGMDVLARRMIARRLEAQDIALVGADMFFPTRGEWMDATNAIFAIDARGRILDRYDKAHLVPYGEYVPMPGLLEALGVARFVPGEGSFLEGPGPRSLDLPGFGRVGIQICYEIIFSGAITDRAHRPDFLFNPSNDAWFGRWGPPQHFAQARLRAIEEGLPVVRATPTGISGVIAADGAVIAALPLDRAGIIETELPAPAAATPFARFGNGLPLAFGVLLILMAFGASEIIALGRRAG